MPPLVLPLFPFAGLFGWRVFELRKGSGWDEGLMFGEGAGEDLVDCFLKGSG